MQKRVTSTKSEGNYTHEGLRRHRGLAYTIPCSDAQNVQWWTKMCSDKLRRK